MENYLTDHGTMEHYVLHSCNNTALQSTVNFWQLTMVITGDFTTKLPALHIFHWAVEY
jgi:hypothetical protein